MVQENLLNKWHHIYKKISFQDTLMKRVNRTYGTPRDRKIKEGFLYANSTKFGYANCHKT